MEKYLQRCLSVIIRNQSAFVFCGGGYIVVVVDCQV